MSDGEKKNLAGLYGMASLGLITGILGMPRYYLKQRFRGSLMSLLFLSGLLLVVYHYISIYMGIAAQAVDALSSLGSGQADFAQIPSLTPNNLTPDFITYVGFLFCALGGGWFFIDLFFLPSALKKYNQEIEQRVRNKQTFDTKDAQRFLQQE